MVQEEKNKYIVSDVEFDVSDAGSSVIVTHPHWSINGIGKNISEAVMDLFNEAEIISEMFIDEPDEKLSPGAQEFKQFLLNLSKKK